MEIRSANYYTATFVPALLLIGWLIVWLFQNFVSTAEVNMECKWNMNMNGW
jgi:hypothetical protein